MRHAVAWVVVVLVALLSACAEDIDVSRDEAIEVLVLDGVPRARAICIVDGVDGRIDLAKVTGVDAVIDEDEIADLASVSGGCVSSGRDIGGVVDAGGAESQLEISEGGGVEEMIAERIETLVTGGLDPIVGECVGQAIAAFGDPVAALDNPNFITEAIGVCSR